MRNEIIFVVTYLILFSTGKGCESRDLYRRPSMPWIWTCSGCPPPYFPDDLPQIRGSRQLRNKVHKRAFQPWFFAPPSSQYPFDTPFFPTDEKDIFDRSIMQVR